MPSPKITVLQRGGLKGHHAGLTEACHAFLRAQASARLVNTLAVRIELRATKLDAGTHGLVWLNHSGSKAQKAYTVVAQRDAHLDAQLVTLAHETVHIVQRATGRLQFRPWRSDAGHVHARWEGRELGRIADIPYRQRPWEIEAFDLENKLYRDFLRARA